MLKWYKEKINKNLPSYTCNVAFKNGHMEMVMWCRENGCNCNTCKKYEEIILYNGC